MRRGASRRTVLQALPAIVATSGCSSPAKHPGYSPGIGAHAGVRDLYRLAEATRTRLGLPALGVGIVHRGRVQGLGMAGERAAGSGDWATLQDLFDVASCSKSVTATVAAMLVERGVLRWETTLGKAFADLREGMHPAFAAVTLEQLLRHRSGLGHDLNRNRRWAEWYHRHAGLSPGGQRLAFVAEALRRPPRSTPGTETFYTSDAYVVAGSLLERASGSDWAALARASVFDPLGLRSMGFGVEPLPGAVIVAGHEPGWFGLARVVPFDVSEYGPQPFGAPAGFLRGSVPDLLRYVDFHVQGANGRATLLRQASFRRLHRALGGESTALGWMSEARRDANGNIVEHSVFHGGYNGRGRANLWFVPESEWGTVIVTNDGRGDETVTREIFFDLIREFGLIAR